MSLRVSPILHVIAEFPDRGRVELSGFGEAGPVDA